jgi:phosphoserine aminotransferase
MKRVYNFNPGPSTLPQSVLEKAAKGILEIENSGMSILETSHRGKEYEKIHFEARELILKVLGLDSTQYSVLFLGGGASLQFAMLPMNFLGKDAASAKHADYINTGEWSTKAIKEAKLFGKINVLARSEESKFSTLPLFPAPTSGSAYYHYTTNNTIEGTQFHQIPETGSTPLVADVSSDFACRPGQYSKYSMLYAGAQKNAGPSGVAIVVARKDFLAKANGDIPAVLGYKTHEKADSLYNTPPSFAIYVVNLVMHWILEQGGLEVVGRNNEKKAKLIYDAMDEFPGVYEPAVQQKKDRSLMNITWRLKDKDPSLEEKFLAGAKELSLMGLKGHRSVGGFRASVYNAFPMEGAEVLADYIRKFAK